MTFEKSSLTRSQGVARRWKWSSTWAIGSMELPDTDGQMGLGSRIAAASVLALLILPAPAQARGGYTHHNTFDSEHAKTADFLAKPCARFTDACKSLVSLSVGADFWGCAPIRNQGVDENAASKAVYEWLRANKAGSRSSWSTDVEIAFHTVYPSCQDDER